MPDINKMISEPSLAPGVVDRITEISEWSEEVALRRAALDGLRLGPDHWEAISFMRDYYIQHGDEAHLARRLTEALDRNFAARGGRRHLYQLFPQGPISQGGHLAGLPELEGTVQPGFGSVM